MGTERNRFSGMAETVGKKEKENAGTEMTFSGLASEWLENSRIRIKESSYIKYRNLLRNHILPEIGEDHLVMLTTERIGIFIRKKLIEGRRDGKGGLSEKSVKDITALLRSICSYGNQLDYDIPCRFELLKFRRSDCEIRILDRSQCAVLERYLLQDRSLVKTGILLSLFMGLRIGEVCALKKENVLYKDAILQIRCTMQRIQDREKGGKKTKIIITEPKSGNSVRDIPIPVFLLERLYELNTLPGEAYILTGDTEKFIEPRTLENIFKRYLKACGMPDINYHALRHTFATRCIEVGFDVKSLSEILGHASVNITLNRYVHSSMEQKRDNMKKLRLIG